MGEVQKSRRKWFSLSREEPVASGSTPVVSTGSIFSQERIAKLFSSLKEEMDDMPRDSLYASERHGAFTSVERVQRQLAKIDPKRLSKRDRDTIELVLYSQLPSAVTRCVSTSFRGWAYVSASGIVSEIGDLHDQLAVIARKQLDPAYERSEQPDSEQVSDLSQLTFPTKRFESRELNAALSTLEKAWRAACQRALDVEDRFLVEQIATAYLPDSWRMISGFETFPAANRARVERHVLEQIGLLTEQLEVILTRNVERSLGAIEAHTQFLRAKKEQRQESKLKLAKGKR